MQPFWSSFPTGYLSSMFFLRVYYFDFGKKAINLWLIFSEFSDLLDLVYLLLSSHAIIKTPCNGDEKFMLPGINAL